MGTLLVLDDLQGGTDGIGGGIGSAAQQSVGVAHLHQHGAEVVALLQQLAALLSAHLALAQLHHQIHHLVHAVEFGGVDDLGAVHVEAGLFGGGADLIRVAHQNGGQEIALEQAVGRLQNTGVGALGEHDLAGVLLQLLNQEFKHGFSSFISLPARMPPRRNYTVLRRFFVPLIPYKPITISPVCQFVPMRYFAALRRQGCVV